MAAVRFPSGQAKAKAPHGLARPTAGRSASPPVFARSESSCSDISDASEAAAEAPGAAVLHARGGRDSFAPTLEGPAAAPAPAAAAAAAREDGECADCLLC